MTTQTHLQTAPSNVYGMRVDQILAQLFPDYSRSCLQRWLKEGRVQVDGQVLKPKDKLQGGEAITLTVEQVEQVHDQAESIPLDIIYEDEAILVLNKPADLVVHPGAGNQQGTLLNALLYHAPELAQLPRAGLVHRLDKDTTGVMVVAKTIPAQTALVAQLQARSVKREYEAIVVGTLISGKTITAPIGRHPKQRTQMAVVLTDAGKPAVSHVRILERYPEHTRVAVSIETGRTHQIRVHLAHIGYPVLGDSVYGKRLMIPKGAEPELVAVLRSFKRQALHARRLTLLHPVTHKKMTWKAPVPEDFATLRSLLQATVVHGPEWTWADDEYWDDDYDDEEDNLL